MDAFILYSASLYKLMRNIGSLSRRSDTVQSALIGDEINEGAARARPNVVEALRLIFQQALFIQHSATLQHKAPDVMPGQCADKRGTIPR